MSDQRFTIDSATTIVGEGVHSGRECVVHIRPAALDQGIRINGTLATIDAVIERPLCTALDTAQGSILTIEHLMAALWGLGIDDVSVEVHGGELPILDGSVQPWIDAIKPVPNGGRKTRLVCDEPIEISRGASWIRCVPSEVLHLSVELDYPELGVLRCEGGLAQFKQMGNARTFGFERDAQRLRTSGMAMGASLANTVVFDDQGRPLNEGGLRHPQEPARHKWLDLIGDLALCGGALQAKVESYRGGHSLNRELVRLLVGSHKDQLS